MINPSGLRPPVRDERWLWLLFAAAWAAHLGFSLVGWDLTLLSRFQFRQVQTAISTLFFPGNAFPLAYELPLFGAPFAVPLEFPLYQASVVWFARLAGLELEPAGRAVSWLYFQSALPAVFLLLGSLGLRRDLRWITLALVVTSPLYLFFSRCFLIESLALAASLWFLAAFARFLSGRHPAWLAVCWVAGAAGGSVKVTTWAVYLVGAAALCLVHWWPDRRLALRATRLAALRAVVAAVPPFAAALAWTFQARAVRDLNPETAILNTHFGFWSFGDLAQRFSANYWLRTTEVWMNGVLSDAGLAVGLLLFARAGAVIRRPALGAAAVFLSGQLVFSNLYMVHDYYFYANGVFLLAALGLVLADFFADPSNPRWLRWALPAVLIAFQLASYGRSYLPDQRIGETPPEYTRAIRDLTRPDDQIIVLGQDWDASTPYYAGRRALMLTAGRERDPAAIRRSVERLDPATVGAVVIFGHLRNDATFAAEAFAPLQLGTTPLLLNHPAQVGIWIPQARVAEAIDRLPSRPYATLDVTQSRATADGVTVLGQREIARLREFNAMSPRPFRASTLGGFSQSYVGTDLVLNAHAPVEVAFRIPSGATQLEAVVGIHEGAYAQPEGRTDGVTFSILQLTPDGREHSLFSRHLDPAAIAGDRGPQPVKLDLRPGGGEVVVKGGPGPAGNGSFDWSYLGTLRLR